MGRKKLTGKSEPVVDEPIWPPRLALSILEFCDAHGISEGFYYKLKKQREGPREMRLGKRTLITFESAADWRRERELAGAAEAAKAAKAAAEHEAAGKAEAAAKFANSIQPETGRAKSKLAKSARRDNAHA
jgi:predicted DNA-binding transcriptional regulator AlpA